MSSTEDLERRRARGQAVDEAYERLRTFEVNRRRIVLSVDDSRRSGGYGVVQQAQLHSSSYIPTWLASRRYGPPQHVAVKQIKLSEVESVSDAKRAFTKELLVWSGLQDHPGIAKFLGFYAKFERLEAWLLSPWEPYGNVMEFVHKRELEVPEKLSLVYDTIDALAFLHQLNPPVCHGDIKSANVLINSNCRAVLCDFGLARLYEDIGFGRLETSTGFKGSIRWCSPEILDGHPRTPKSDVYAWAWLVWEIMTGELPYEGTLADYSIIRRIFESPRPQIDGEARLSDSLQVWELMTRCWVADPEERPTASMCRTTIAYLPRCPATPDNIDRGVRSAALLENIGDLESWKGNYTEGLSYLEQALHVYEEEGNEKGVASVLRKQVAVHYRHSYHLKALKAGVAALENFRNLDDPLGTAEVLYLMGSSLTIQSGENDAMPFLREALEIFQRNGNDVGAVQCLERIGEIQRRGRLFREAALTLENAVETARRCGDKLGESKALIILALLYYDENDNARAVSTLSETCDTARRIGWEHGVCTALCHLGFIKSQEGAYSEAEELCRESASVARRSYAWWRLGQSLSDLGYCLHRQGRLDEATAALEESCSVYHEISLTDWESARASERLADVKKEQGKLNEALIWHDHAIAQNRTLQDTWRISSHLMTKGNILTELQRYDEAALHYEASLALCTEHGYYRGWVRNALSGVPKTTITWECRKQLRQVLARNSSVSQTSPLLCDIRRLQRRIPQLVTAGLKLPTGSSSLSGV